MFVIEVALQPMRYRFVARNLQRLLQSDEAVRRLLVIAGQRRLLCGSRRRCRCQCACFDCVVVIVWPCVAVIIRITAKWNYFHAFEWSVVVVDDVLGSHLGRLIVDVDAFDESLGGGGLEINRSHRRRVVLVQNISLVLDVSLFLLDWHASASAEL